MKLDSLAGVSFVVDVAWRGLPLVGALVEVRLVMGHRNDYVSVHGPSDAAGRIAVTAEALEEWIEADAAFSPSDYATLDQWTGRVTVSVVGPATFERVQRAFDQMRRFYRYPAKFAEVIRRPYVLDSSDDLSEVSLRVVSGGDVGRVTIRTGRPR